ncbi:MAG: cadherin-like beta sandwich domain-containing protein [Clostridia bacterium]|nr:cadherin-like beta sandwich domain-containing protein [Clostridia bacterium]
MKRKILSKVILILILSIFILLVMTIKSNAASLSISTSKSSVSPGETFTVTVSVSGGAGSVSASVSNGSGGKTDFLDNNSFSFSCTAGSSGSVSITASGTVADYTTEQDESKSASKSVSIVQPSSSTSGGGSSSGGTTTKPKTNTTETKKSSDNSLKELTIAEGAITPEFNRDVREYSLTVPNEITILNVTATANHSKASVVVEGNAELKEGENTVTVTVKAEDGSTSKYLIRVIRNRPVLSLQSLIIKYSNQNGELIEIPLNPIFNFETYEYALEDLEYWVEKLEIEAIANIEGATIDIQGADTLIEGENIVTIVAKIPVQTQELAEGEEPQEEIKTYVIRFNKKAEPVPPTLMGRISNWFRGIFGGVTSWYGNNQEQIILSALGICIASLVGLSIYIVIDYKKYKTLLQKIKKLNEIEQDELVEQDILETPVAENSTKKTVKKDTIEKTKQGRHF